MTIEMSMRELKITAALYTHRPGVLETVRATGRLPEHIPMGGGPIALRVLIETRGTDIELDEEEQIVYEALLRENRLPGGSAVLIEEEMDRQAKE